MDTPEEQEAKARRKLPLYTMDLTPMFEVSDEMWEVLGPPISRRLSCSWSNGDVRHADRVVDHGSSESVRKNGR